MHLQHKIPWNQLVECLRIDDTEISLPVGECGKIHLIDKATEIQVSSRKFIKQHDICIPSCATPTKLRIFSKNKLSSPILSFTPRRGDRYNDKLKFINEKFFETVLEFVEEEEKKFRVIPNFPATVLPELLDMRCTECYRQPCEDACEGFVVFSLYSRYEIEKLLWLDSIGKVSVKNALCTNYGGQAVGNGYRYLVLYHLLPFYIRSNAIIASGYELCEDKWGELAPHAYFRREIDYDNDFPTFIPGFRPYLHKDVYMKDMKKTMELLRIVFRHIYVYVYLLRKFGDYDVNQIRKDFECEIHYSFGFRNFY